MAHGFVLGFQEQRCFLGAMYIISTSLYTSIELPTISFKERPFKLLFQKKKKKKTQDKKFSRNSRSLSFPKPHLTHSCISQSVLSSSSRRRYAPPERRSLSGPFLKNPVPANPPRISSTNTTAPYPRMNGPEVMGSSSILVVSSTSEILIKSAATGLLSPNRSTRRQTFALQSLSRRRRRLRQIVRIENFAAMAMNLDVARARNLDSVWAHCV